MGRLTTVGAGLTWRAVDASGRDADGADTPSPPGSASSAAALAGMPVVTTWPIQVLADDGRRAGLAEALGSGGRAVEQLLDRLRRAPSGLPAGKVATLASATPAGPVDLPLALVPLAEGVERSTTVDAAWMEEVDHNRCAPRAALLAAGRGPELEAALHVSMLLATEALDPAVDTDVGAHVASGAQLWLVAGAVAWALAAGEANPFGPWSELVAERLWPVGPSEGHLVVSTTEARPPPLFPAPRDREFQGSPGARTGDAVS